MPPSEPPIPSGHCSLGALRAELDRLDDNLHDLLMQRADIVAHIGLLGRKGRIKLRPGREASILRRLLARHHGGLPPRTLVRIWRELFAGTTAMQAPLSIAVHGGAALEKCAREQFGMLTPLQAYPSPAATIAALLGDAAVAVLPWPNADNRWWSGPWWSGPWGSGLKQEPEVHVVGRLPFWTALGGLAEAGGMEAAVLSMQPPDPSGLDRSLLIYHGDKIADIDRHLIALGFRPADIVKQGDMALIDVEGFVAADDPRLAAAAGTVLAGAYACPVSG